MIRLVSYCTIALSSDSVPSSTRQYFEPDPPNETNPKEAIEKVTKNDKSTKDVNLNNITHIDEVMFCELFEGLRTNDSLVRLSATNCDVNDFSVAVLCLAFEKNRDELYNNRSSRRINSRRLFSRE